MIWNGMGSIEEFTLDSAVPTKSERWILCESYHNDNSARQPLISSTCKMQTSDEEVGACDNDDSASQKGRCTSPGEVN
jgi:hypothetical protein